jgi:GAF domain-containing protein
MGWVRRLGRPAARRDEGPADRPTQPVGAEVSPCVSASTLEDLALLLVKAAAKDVEIGELCTCAARVSQATGCALMGWDPLAGESRIHAAVGTWEETPLRPILEGASPDWALALEGAPVCACRDEKTVRAFQWRQGSGDKASGLAMPIIAGEEACGALLCTYPAPRVFTPDEVRMIRLVACHAALIVRHQALAATVERQAQRIARLVDDVERMLISLRRATAQGDRKGGS